MKILLLFLFKISIESACNGLRNKLFTFNNIKSTTNKVSKKSKEVVSDEAQKILKYDGPISDYNSMEAGCSISDIGLDVMVGPSVSASGRGLFISVSEDCETSTLPRGTAICGYAKGSFTNEYSGDKTVAYYFNDVNAVIYFKQKLTPLYKALSTVAEESDNMTKSLCEHILLFEKESEQILIEPDPNYDGYNYFVPNGTIEFGPATFGQFANDLAYHNEISEEDYLKLSEDKNILSLVWRLDVIDGILTPIWPVVILTKDVTFTNHEPMEVGLHYSWRYWLASRNL